MDRIDKHINDLRRISGGRNVSSSVYEYILTQNDLWRALEEQKEDLQYALRKEVKRDRYVLNSKAIKQAVDKAVNKVMKDFEKDIHDYLSHDLMNYISDETTSLLNTLYTDGTSFKTRKPETKSFSSKLGAELGKAIVNELFKAFNND